MTEKPKMKSVTKSDLVSVIAESVKLSKSDVDSVVTRLLQAIMEHTAAQSEVRFIGFGTFGSRATAERMGKNPKTGEPIHVPASRVPTFRAGQAWKDTVKGR